VCIYRQPNPTAPKLGKIPHPSIEPDYSRWPLMPPNQKLPEWRISFWSSSH